VGFDTARIAFKGRFGIGFGIFHIAQMTPGGGAKDQRIDQFGINIQSRAKVLFGALPGTHGGSGLGAVDKQFRVFRIEPEGAVQHPLGARRLTGQQPGLGGLGKQLGAKGWPRANTLSQFLEAPRAFAMLAKPNQRHRLAMMRRIAAAEPQPTGGAAKPLFRIVPRQLHAGLVFPRRYDLLGQRWRSHQKGDHDQMASIHFHIPYPGFSRAPHNSTLGIRKQDRKFEDACMSEAGTNLLCFGMGYTARALAASLDAGRWRTTGTFRDGEALAGYDGVAFDDADAVLAEASHVLVSTPPGEAGDPVLARYAEQLAAHKNLAWVGYLSTTGVYGDTGGAAVDESAPCAPTNARSRWRADAELAWLALDIPLHIFRLAGIYGPGRSAFDQVRAGTARRIDRPGYKFSRIHVDDVANILRASMAAPAPGAIYNVCDDAAAAQAEIVAHACDLLGATAPTLIPFAAAEPDMSPMARSFWSDNRRIDNGRIKRELGITLRFSDYRSGLAAILAAENSD